LKTRRRPRCTPRSSHELPAAKSTIYASLNEAAPAQSR
jgi:hypothetical protein